MSILNTSKLTWFKDGGEPLKSGYIYVGQPNFDPQVPANQKTVTFTDSQGNSFTAPQPLRTNTDGRVQWNGKAITASVDGDYSLLVLNSNQVEINGGWTPNVSGSSTGTGDLNNYREYGSTLADIKQVNVSVGETIASIGKLIATDNLGASWLVVSATGSPADDIDIIDFDNGLQGTRIKNYVQESDGIVLRAENDLSDVDDVATARTNLDVYSKSESNTNYINDSTGTVKNGNIAKTTTFSAPIVVVTGTGGTVALPGTGQILDWWFNKTSAPLGQFSISRVSATSAYIRNDTGFDLTGELYCVRIDN